MSSEVSEVKQHSQSYDEEQPVAPSGGGCVAESPGVNTESPGSKVKSSGTRPNSKKTPKYKQAYSRCSSRKVRCDGLKPKCGSCFPLDIPCEYALSRRSGTRGPQSRTSRKELAARSRSIDTSQPSERTCELENARLKTTSDLTSAISSLPQKDLDLLLGMARRLGDQV